MISDLFVPVSVDDVKAAIYAQLERVGVKTSDWKPGAVVRTLIAVVAVLASTFSQLVALVSQGGWLSTATGDWLTNKAAGDYDTDRIPATPASGVLRLTNTAGGSFTVAAGDYVATNPSTGAQYRNTAAFSLLPLGSVDITVEATEAGAWTSSAAGTVTEHVTSMTGVTVTNPLSLIGTDPETDARLRQRARMAPAQVSPAGPGDAYSYLARTLPRADGTPMGITRSRTIPLMSGGHYTGAVAVVVATPSGAPLAADITYLQDQIVRLATPQCVTPVVTAANAHAFTIGFIAYTRDPAVSSTTGLALARAALLEYVGQVPIGGYVVSGGSGVVPLNGLRAVIQGAIPGCFRVDITGPTADVALLGSDVAVAGTISGVTQYEQQL